MVLDLGDDPSARRPAVRLVLEALVPDHGLATWTASRTKQDVFDLQFQGLASRNADGILHVGLFEQLVDLGLGKGRVRAKGDVLVCRLLAVDFRQEQFVPVGGAVDVARPQFRGQTIAIVIERKQRMVADGLEVPVMDAAFLLPCTGLSLESMSSTTRSVPPCISAWASTSRFTAIRPTRFSSRVNNSVSNQCKVDVSAPPRSQILGDPINRHAGSAASRSASLRSSYPASRP